MSPRSDILIKLSKRDVEILHFLWRWKVCTTRALSQKYFSGSDFTAYDRLRLLKNGGYIRLLGLNEEYGRFVWTLSNKGFQEILEGMDALREVGFASEYLKHDLYVVALHLGDWLMDTPKGVEFFSEQELRRCYPSNYPAWVPQLNGRRPDGYWLIPYRNEQLVFALEVEFSIKDQKEYGPIGRFYADAEGITRVFWLVESSNIALKLQNRFRQISKTEYEKHNFIIRPDFEKQGWQSRIIAGYEVGKTLAFAVCAGQILSTEWTLNGPVTSLAHLVLDTTKCGLKPRSSSEKGGSDFLNSMVLQPLSLPSLSIPSNHSSHTPNSDASQSQLTITKEDNNHE